MVPEAPGAGADDGTPPLPSFPKRFAQVFFSPGDLTQALARKPAWAAALFTGVVLTLVQLALIPPEVWETMFREGMLRQGTEMPAGFDGGGTIMRVSSVVGGAVAFLVMSFVFAGVVTLVFAFVMGDEGKYKQYLAMLSHAWLIPTVVGLALLPLKISQSNPQFTLNLGAFFFFLPDGYILKVFKMLDLSQVWSWFVLAQGAHAIDAKRSFGSAATVLAILFVAVIMLMAVFVPMPA
jgi:hypothetical protein